MTIRRNDASYPNEDGRNDSKQDRHALYVLTTRQLVL
jgi:hypothetical protein